MFRPSARLAAAGMRPEWELLLCSARSVINDNCSGRIRELVQGDIDWGRLVKMASSHHVTPLLCRSLLAVCPDAVPGAMRDHLERAFASNVACSLALASDLLKVLKWLKAHDIPAIPFKGPTLASLAYGGLALRQAGDLDILVREPDAIKAKHLLISHGFRSYLEMSDDQEFDCSHHFMLVRDERPITIEIHWRLIDDFLFFNLSEDSLWREARSTKLAGVDVPCFPMPELILYLCAHGTKHCWERLSWICDIAELIRVERGIEWDLVMRRARAIGAERMLSLGLLLATDLLEAPLTGAIARKIRSDATTRGLAHKVLERYLRETNSPPEFTEMWQFNLTARERRRDRLRSRLKLIVDDWSPNERDLAFLHLPAWFSFLYHGVKPVRLASKYALNPSGFLRMIGELAGFR